jgi:hypothetical protein
MNDAANQDTLRLKQMLEEVTGDAETVTGNATEGVPRSGDVETASLRETWLALGQLIRAADASLPPLPDMAAPIVPQKRGRSRWLGLIAATAAALLLAVTYGWLARGPGVPPANDGIGTSPSNGGSEEATESGPPTPTALVKQEQPKPAAARISTWDDPLETQIAVVSQQIRAVEQDWRRGLDDVDLVRYRIDEVSDTLQSDKL